MLNEPPKPKILQFRFEPKKEGVLVGCSFGLQEVTREFPHGHIPSRIAAIFDGNGALVDIELVVERVSAS